MSDSLNPFDLIMALSERTKTRKVSKKLERKRIESEARRGTRDGAVARLKAEGIIR